MKKIIIEDTGMLFLVSPGKFREALNLVAAKQQIDWSNFGKSIGIIEYDATDLDQDAALTLLKMMETK